MREYIVEYLGTVFFLYVVVVTQNPFAIGAALAMVIYLGGPISGGHYNPAITLVKVLTGDEPSSVLAPYIIAQLAAVFTVYQIHKRLKK
jgi:aquaporin Z